MNKPANPTPSATSVPNCPNPELWLNFRTRKADRRGHNHVKNRRPNIANRNKDRFLMGLARPPRLLISAKKQKAEIHSNAGQNREKSNRHHVEFVKNQHPKSQRHQGRQTENQNDAYQRQKPAKSHIK